MTQKLILTGTADKGNGDPIRTAFTKVNDNFTELYTALGLNDLTLNLGAFEFTGSVMTTTDSSAIIIDQATTVTSNLSVGGDIVPQTANGGDLGSSTLPWRSLYVSNNTIYIGGVPLGIDANGNLTVDGSQIAGGGGGSSLVNGSYTVSLGSNGALTFPQGTTIATADGTDAFLIDGAVDKDVQIYTYSGPTPTAHGWTFGADGTLTLPAGGTINNTDGIILITDRGTLAIGTNMETPGVAGHFHIAFDGSNNNPPANDLFLGDDYNYVKLPGSELNPATYGVEIGTGNRGAGPQNIEVDDVDELVPPGGVWRFFIDHNTYPNLGSSVSVGDTVTTSWGTPITATITDVVEEVGVSWKIHVAQDITAGFSFYDTVSFGASGDSHTWRFGTDGTLTLPSGNTRIGNVFGTDGIVGSTGTGVGVGSLGQGGYAALQWIDDPEDATSVAAIVVNSPIASTSGTVQIATGIVAGPTAENVWEFDANGVLTLPANGTISYAPDDSDNWNSPTVNTIQAALDELAAKVAALENFEIDGGNAYTPAAGELIIDGNGA